MIPIANTQLYIDTMFQSIAVNITLLKPFVNTYHDILTNKLARYYSSVMAV